MSVPGTPFIAFVQEALQSIIEPFNRLSPSDFERLCLWLVQREGYLRCRELTEEEIAIVKGWNH